MRLARAIFAEQRVKRPGPQVEPCTVQRDRSSEPLRDVAKRERDPSDGHSPVGAATNVQGMPNSLRQVRRQRAHAESLRGVVAGVHDHQPLLLRVHCAPVRALSRDERVDAPSSAASRIVPALMPAPEQIAQRRVWRPVAIALATRPATVRACEYVQPREQSAVARSLEPRTPQSIVS